jgi:ferritin-like metal-binding protein YciE
MGAGSLQEIYADELKDLWSANDQMAKIVDVMAEKAMNSALKDTLTQSIADINKHAASIRELLLDADEDAEMEHCKGMEGLVKEAAKHVTKEPPESRELLDIVIIAQYQRMSHYGLAGFGTAAAYAKALGMDEHSKKMERIVKDIHEGDKYASLLAEHAEEVASADIAAE